MPAQKFTRKELKQDSFVEWTSRAYDFIQENSLRLGIGVVAVVVLIVAISFYGQGKVKARESAAALLFQGQMMLMQGEYAAAEERLQECRREYGGTMFGRQARLDLAHALLIQGQEPAALDVIEEGLREIEPTDEMTRSLLKLKAACLMNLEQYADASPVYRQLLDGATANSERIAMSKRLARSLKQEGKIRDAILVLETLKQAVDQGEIELLQSREIETLLHTYRALDI